MRIGLFVGALALMRDVAERLQRISDAERDSFDSYWLPQHFGADMLTVHMLGRQRRKDLGADHRPVLPPGGYPRLRAGTQVAVPGRRLA